MKPRRRINISVDPHTYSRLSALKNAHGFKSVCELVTACLRIMLDRTEGAQPRQYDLPPDDGDYIDAMFDELAHHERQPDGTVPVRHKSRKCE